MKHTPGPWQIKMKEKQYYSSDTGQPTFKTNYVDIIDQGDRCVGYTYPTNDSYVANAHLIAAAPDLFEAVSRVLIEMEEWDGEISIGAVEDMQAAIAKATEAVTE